jgi:hypothetical protein
MRGYSNAGSVAAYLATTFDAAGTAEANAALAAAEETIDDYTGRAWLTGDVLTERVEVVGPYVYLRNAPVASVGTVTGRYYGSTAPATLAQDTDYELTDLNRGLLVLPGYGRAVDADGFPLLWPYYDYLQVSYTPGTPVPARVSRAATILAARGIRPTLTGGNSDVIERTAGDLTLRFDATAMQSADMPAEVQMLLAPLRRGLIA